MSEPADNRFYRAPVKREVVWPILLIAVISCWCLVFSFSVKPMFGQRWMQVLCGIVGCVEASRRIWNGRFEA